VESSVSGDSGDGCHGEIGNSQSDTHFDGVNIYFGSFMPTLYVKNVPDELYRGLRKRACEKRSSIAAEVIALLQRTIPTALEMKRREQFYQSMAKFRANPQQNKDRFPSTEKMIREDRER
jgi:plasmid stability protein